MKMPGFHVLAAIISFSCLVNFSECRTTHKKREWPIKLCVSDNDCDGGCCKGLFCFRYLSEGERCLFGHQLRVGCGCEASLQCEKKSLPWDHTCTKKITTPTEEEEVEEIPLASTPSTLEVLTRELQDFIDQDSENSDLIKNEDSATTRKLKRSKGEESEEEKIEQALEELDATNSTNNISS